MLSQKRNFPRETLNLLHLSMQTRLYVNLLLDRNRAVRPEIFLLALASSFTLPSGDSR